MTNQESKKRVDAVAIERLAKQGITSEELVEYFDVSNSSEAKVQFSLYFDSFMKDLKNHKSAKGNPVPLRDRAKNCADTLAQLVSKKTGLVLTPIRGENGMRSSTVESINEATASIAISNW